MDVRGVLCVTGCERGQGFEAGRVTSDDAIGRGKFLCGCGRASCVCGVPRRSGSPCLIAVWRERWSVYVESKGFRSPYREHTPSPYAQLRMFRSCSLPQRNPHNTNDQRLHRSHLLLWPGTPLLTLHHYRAARGTRKPYCCRQNPQTSGAQASPCYAKSATAPHALERFSRRFIRRIRQVVSWSEG